MTVSTQYHDYILSASFIGATESTRASAPDDLRLLFSEQARNTYAESSIRPAARFATIIGEYFERLKHNQRALLEVSEIGHLSPEEFATYLYNPLYCESFGYSDGVAFTLLDDFDPLFSSTTHVHSPITNTSIGFCPKFNPETPHIPACYRQPHELLQGSAQMIDAQGDCPVSEYRLLPGIHPIQTKLPLTAYCEFTLGMLHTMLRGDVARRALHLAVLARISETLESLRRYIRSSPVPVVSLCDLDDLAVSLIDLQGPADLGLIVFASNYTVAASLVMAIRGLTIEDACKALPEYGLALRRSKGHSAFWTRLQRQHQQDPQFTGNHVFSHSYTTLGVSPQVFCNPDKSHPIRGYVEFNANFNVNPGHFSIIERAAWKTAETLLRMSVQWTMDFGPRTSYHYFTVGSFDLTYRPSFHVHDADNSRGARVPIDERATGMPTHVFILAIQLLHEHLGIRRKQDNGKLESTESGVLDISTILCIPVPRLWKMQGKRQRLIPSTLPEHHAPTLAVLRDLAASLFDSQPQGREAAFDSLKLDGGMRQLAVPKTLRRAILYLYQNYRRCIEDPHLIVPALDLYDALATLYQVLAVTLPSLLIAEESLIRRRAIFNEDRIEELSLIVAAVETAMAHRMTGKPLHSRTRETAIDIRGGLSNLIAGLELPLKCSFGLIKAMERIRSGVDVTRADLGSVVCLSPHPQTIVRQAQFGLLQSQRGNYRPSNVAIPSVNYIELPATSLFNPTEFTWFLHEACHLLDSFDNAFREVAATAPEIRSMPDAWATQITADRLVEVFVGQLTHLFIYGLDSELFTKHLLCKVGVQAEARGSDEIDTLIRVVELLLRAYLIVFPFSVCRRSYGDNIEEWPLDERSFASAINNDMHTPSIDAAFVRFANEHGPYIWQYKQARKSTARFNDYCATRFNKVYARLGGLHSKRFLTAMRAYRDYVSERWTGFNRTDVDQRIEDGLSDYTTITSVLVDSSDGQYADELLVVCSSLKSYLKFLFRDIDASKNVHLSRDYSGDSPTGRIVYSGATSVWSGFQVDDSTSDLRSPIPDLRRQRIGRQVSLLASFADLTGELRSRRFGDLAGRTREPSHEEPKE